MLIIVTNQPCLPTLNCDDLLEGSVEEVETDEQQIPDVQSEDVLSGAELAGGVRGSGPPQPRPGPLMGYVQIRRVFSGGGTPLVKFGIADFTALFASLSVTFSDAVWRRHRTKVSAVC